MLNSEYIELKSEINEFKCKLKNIQEILNKKIIIFEIEINGKINEKLNLIQKEKDEYENKKESEIKTNFEEEKNQKNSEHNNNDNNNNRNFDLKQSNKDAGIKDKKRCC